MAQRQFLTTDTSLWVERFGNGSDGALTISSDTTETPINSACTGTAGATSLSATNASFTAGQLLLIHQSRGTGVGIWELNKIASYVAGTITTSYTLINSYASGAQVHVLKQYSSVTIDSTKTLTAAGWDGSKGGILAFVCSGAVSVVGNISASGRNSSASDSINTAGGGFRGGGGITNSTAQQGEGETGIGGASQSANGEGGGAGKQGSGGGTGGTAAQTDATLTTKLIFGGGGGGMNGNSGQPQAMTGANGGGIIFIIAKTITVSGTLSVNGGQGKNSSSGQGPGGSGGGGCVLLKGQTLTLGSTLVTATSPNSDTATLSGDAGGSGAGSTNGTNGNGSANPGGVGRIHVDYSTLISGTTSPTINSSIDAIYIDPSSGSGNLAFFI